MEGGETEHNCEVCKCCNCCKSCLQNIYWNHFHFLHFTQFLRNAFHQHLALPKTFSDNIKKKLPGDVELRGPSGVVWNIGLTTKDDTLYFTRGWEQFLKAHSLKENDLLVFKYNGESRFDVSMFDGETLCEKAGSYFVRKCGHVNTDKNSVEEVVTPSNDGVECGHPNNIRVSSDVPSETPNGKTFDKPTVVPFQTTRKRTSNSRPVYAVSRHQTKRRGRKPKASNLVTHKGGHVAEFAKATSNKGTKRTKGKMLMKVNVKLEVEPH